MLHYYSKAFDCVDHNKVENFSRDELRHLTCFLRNLYVD